MAAQRPGRSVISETVMAAVVACFMALTAVQAQDLGDLGAGAEEDQPIALVADEVTFDSNTGIVTARGAVEVYYGERTLTAEEIVYDSENDTFNAEGKIAIRNPDGTILYADIAELDGDLRNGLARGARTVMADGSRMSAVAARRIDGDTNALSRAVFSPCDVCASDPEPLWQIRARRVVHDQIQKEVFYEDAVFEVEGVDVFWMPYFSHPDPTVKRRSGFLTPSFQSSTTYGYGIKTPYHYILGPSSDITLTPFVMSNDGLIMEGEYRAVRETGFYAFRGSITQNDFTGEDEIHGHLFGRARFDAPADFKYGGDIEVSSDDAYLRRFDFTSRDRLTSELFLRRFQNDGFASISGLYFQSNRSDEPQEEIPVVLPEIQLRQRFDAPYIGGDLFANGDVLALSREEGRDVVRLSAGLDWEDSLVSETGFAFRGFAESRADVYFVDDDPDLDETNVNRLLGLAGVEARYPFVRQGQRNTQIFEPIAQFILANEGGNPEGIPNEDSQEISFDDTNLFATSRAPGLDLWEEGSRINMGWRYELLSDGGLDLNASGGRVLRFEEASEFPDGSGLQGTNSDYVAAWGLAYGDLFRFTNRFRMSDDFELARNEMLVELDYGRWDANASYVFFEADADSIVTEDREEYAFGGTVDLTPAWSLSGGFRYDEVENQLLRASSGLVWSNECVEVDFSLRRRFTRSTGAPASTSFGLEVKLLSLSLAKEDRKRHRACGS